MDEAEIGSSHSFNSGVWRNPGTSPAQSSLLRNRLLSRRSPQFAVAGIMPAMTLVEATYELQKPLTEAQLRTLGTFANTYGLRRFRVDDNNRLSFEYDASRLRDTEVIHVLHQLNIPATKKVN